MYTPPHTKSENLDEAFALMDQHPFATLISPSSNSIPLISHLPITPIRSEDGFALVGHMARANPHWRAFTSNPVTTVFMGPHTYVTPRWYEHNDVPTWNYLAVHTVGRAMLIETYDELIDALKLLSKHAERHWPSGWEFFLPDDLKSPEVVMKSIVGFKIKVDHIEFKKKLHQKSSATDRQGVIEGLATRTDDNSRLVREEMLKIEASRATSKD